MDPEKRENHEQQHHEKWVMQHDQDSKWQNTDPHDHCRMWDDIPNHGQ